MRKAHDEDWFFFDAQERGLVDEALDAIGSTNAKQRLVLEGMLARLRTAAQLIRDSPSLSSTWETTTASKVFSSESLIDQLCRVPDYDLDLHIPTKAVLGQAYLVAKINFLKALGYTVRAEGGAPSLGERIGREVGQSIYTKLAEELFVSIVTDPAAAPLVKTNAAKFLFRIWEERLLIEVDDFAPILESAWEARSKLLPVLGTMLGTHEVFRLFQEARDKRFLDYFGEDHVEEEQLLAFEEFLFDLSHEEITRLRAHLSEEGRACISIEKARELLGGSAATWAPHEHGAQTLYTSYKKRRVNAAHRALTNAVGPKKTAEEYVMITFLQD
ncbi:MAG: hypothetical protein JST00_45500 [Deltaproteobacteria bacterium]|nr:hypothetical protein [Deltaproteobacteria bacterium]